MILQNSLVFIFINTIHLVFLIITELIVGIKLKKPKLFILRIVSSTLILAFLVNLFSVLSSFVLGTPQVNYDRDWLLFFLMLNNIVVLASTLAFVQFVFDCDLITTLVIVIIGHNAYQLVYCIFSLFTMITVQSAGTSFNFDSIFNLNNMSTWVNYIAYIIIFFIVNGIVYFLFIRNKSLNIDMIKNKVVVLVFALVVITHIIAHNVCRVNILDDRQLSSIFVTLLCESVLAFIVLLLQFIFLRHDALKNEMEEEEKRIAITEKNYRFTKDIIEQINIKAHDLKHQIIKLKKSNKIDEETARSISDTINIYESMAKTENETLNVVLSEKWIYCNKHNISLSVIIDSNVMSFMKKSDMYTLLGNALDNSIEASLKLPYEKRAISFVLKNVIGCVSLQISNNFQGNISLDDKGEYKTLKEDKKNHGFGLKSMRYIVEKYGGNLSIKVDKDIFILQAIIPIPNNENM